MRGPKIGEGNTAEIFCWGDMQILKLYRKTMPREAVEKEYEVSRKVSEQGLPVPRVFELIEQDDRIGIIYEKIEGKSLLELIFKKPFASTKYIRILAELQYQFHQCTSVKLPDYKGNLEWNIVHTDKLTEVQKSAVLKQLELLPDGNALCHGDFHPGNIMVMGDKYIILDWMTASIGAVEADVARTILLLRDSALPDNIPHPIKFVLSRMRRKMADTYIKRYMELSGIHLEEINRWRIVIAAARLFEWVPQSEKSALLEEIKKTIRV